MEYKQKYLKYKSKYLKVKGGRLIDILNEPGFAKIKDKCNTPDNIRTNFALCNKTNDGVATSNDSYVIFLCFINQFKEDYQKFLEKIILFHKAKSNNIFIFSNKNFNTINPSINSILVNNTNFENLFAQKIKDIIDPYEKIPIQSNLNITIYNIAHGNLSKYNLLDFLSSDKPNEVCINKEQYYNCLLPIFNCKSIVNLVLVNNNCYSTYIIHGYFREKLKTLPNKNNSNIITYSLRPFIKYLFYLRFILSFFDKSFIEKYSTLSSDNDKFNHFFEINKLINKRLNNIIFANSIKTIFYESIDEFKNSLNKFFYFFQPLCHFEHLNNIFSKLNEPSYKDTYALIPKENIVVNDIDLFKDSNITNSIIAFLEQSSFITTDSYLTQEINNTTLGLNYNHLLDVNTSLKELNNKIRNNNFIDDFITSDWANLGGLSAINEFLPNELLKKLVKMSFIEQKDILFVPVEPDPVKREKMRSIKLIDLL